MPSPRACIAIPSKNRHQSLHRTLPSALACGVPIFICDQSENPYSPQAELQALSAVEVHHCPEIPSLPAARQLPPAYLHRL